MKPYQPSASELAILVVLLVQRYSRERGREVSRFRIARNSLRRLAIRDRLRDALVDEWIDIMALQHGWLTFSHDEEFILLKAETTRTWTKIATKRCDDIIKRLRNGDGSAIDDAAGEIDEPSVPDEDDDEN
jgi:hypothetical protein